MRKIIGIILALCLLAGLAVIPASAAFSIEPAIAAGGSHNVALASNGTVWTWGHLRWGASPSVQRKPVRAMALSGRGGKIHTGNWVMARRLIALRLCRCWRLLA
jgi:hypothetical protein